MKATGGVVVFTPRVHAWRSADYALRMESAINREILRE